MANKLYGQLFARMVIWPTTRVAYPTPGDDSGEHCGPATSDRKPSAIGSPVACQVRWFATCGVGKQAAAHAAPGWGMNPVQHRVCIVLVNYNGLPDTLRCLRSLEAAGRPTAVVVDNASVEDPPPALRRDFPWRPVIRNPVNGGWAGGNNIGVRHALEHGADLIVLLNNDTVVAPDFAARLSAAAEATRPTG